MHCHWLTAGLLAAAYAIELHPLSPSFGLEVRGITRDDLRSKKAHKTLRDAFSASRGLLLLRGLRGLSCDELITLSSVFGDIEAAPADGSYESLVDEAGRVHEFSTVPSSGVFRGKADATTWQYDAETGKPSWHTDQSFRSPRPLASAMYCLETPGDGVGQTVFCSTVAACEDLPEGIRSRLAKLRAAHSYEQLSASFQRFAGGTAKTLSATRKKTLVEPALYHLVDDGALYLAPHAISRVVDETGKEIAKGSELVDALATRCTRPEYVHAHAWKVGDYVVWNNLRTMHAATGVPESAAKRRMWRTTALPRGGGAEADATVTVTASAARAVATAALERSGSSRPQASAAADAFVQAEIDGRAAHGLRRIAEVCDALERGDVAANPDVRVLMDQKSVVVRVDGGGGLAFGPLRDTVDAVAAAAETHGAAVGIVSNTRSVSGRLAPWVERLAERGLVAVLACNTPAYLAVEGSAEPCLGTNPIAWACPRKDGAAPVVVDLALAASSRAAIEVAAAAGAKLPRGVAIDANGKPTRDAAAALDGGAQLPAGGIKGALLALLVEVLSGGLAGGDLAVDSDDYHTMDRSLFLLVVDPAMTTREFDVERLLERFGGRAGAAARESREASARPDGDHDVRVSAALWFELQMRARGVGDVSDVEGALPLD